MEIPDINIPEINIPKINTPYTIKAYVPPIDKQLNIDIQGCTYQHRDIKNTGNRNLLIEDPNGVFNICDVPFPSFYPLDYTPDNLIITEEPLPTNNTTPMPDIKPSIPEVPVNEKKEEVFIKCPSNREQRVGDFRNESKLEKVIGHKLSDDGKECITLYENTKFIDQYIPTPKAISTTAFVAVVAASTPILLNIIKPLVKQVINKLTKKKPKS